MSFGTWGKETDAPKPKSDGDSKLKKEWYRIASNNRFWIDNRKGKNRADVIFVDCPEKFTDEQNHILSGMGLGQGPFSIWEHNVKIGSRWGNYFSSGKNVRMSPLLRLLYLQIVGAWGKVGPHLETYLSDLETLNKYYLDAHVDPKLFKEIIDDEYWNRVNEIISVDLGNSVIHNVHFKSDKVSTDDPISVLFSSKASKRTFRTIIDRTKYTARDGREFVDQLKLFSTSGSQSAKWQSEFDTAGGGRRDKPITGLGCHLYELTRNSGDRIPAVGDEKAYVEQLSLKDLEEINPDSIFVLNRETVSERLSDNNYFNFHRMRASGFDNLNFDAMLDYIIKTFEAEETDVQVPRPADYPLILLPKTPSYISNKYGEGDALDPDEDVVPF